MRWDHDLLFFFAALGAFNSLLLSLYLLRNGRNYPKAYGFLGLLLFEHALRAGFSCLYYFDDAPREFIKLGLSAHVLIGPTLYYFVFFSLKSPEKSMKSAIIHLLMVIGVLMLLGFSFDFETWDYAIRYTLHATLSVYLVFTGAWLLPSFKQWPKRNEWALNTKKAWLVYVAVLLTCLGFFVSLYTNYIVGPLWFSLLFYGFVYRFYQIDKRCKVGTGSYKKKLDPVEVKLIASRLTALMTKEKLYRDPNLTLEKLSQRLSVSRYFLSQMLNDDLNIRYHDFITKYRIEEASELLLRTDHYTLEAIAYEVGFNSKSSFFAAFKRLKGATPATFREQAKV